MFRSPPSRHAGVRFEDDYAQDELRALRAENEQLKRTVCELIAFKQNIETGLEHLDRIERATQDPDLLPSTRAYSPAPGTFSSAPGTFSSAPRISTSYNKDHIVEEERYRTPPRSVPGSTSAPMTPRKTPPYNRAQAEMCLEALRVNRLKKRRISADN